MNNLLRATQVAAAGSELAVAWDNGKESFFPLETLRRACPCAGCGGEPDVLGRVIRPEVSYDPKSFTLSGWEFVGGYGLQPTWGDGHRTGIYSWLYLARLDEVSRES